MLTKHDPLSDAIAPEDQIMKISPRKCSTTTHDIDNHWKHFNPFQLGIDWVPKTSFQTGHSKNMQPGPRFSWPCPRMQRSNWWSGLQHQALWERVHIFHRCLLQLWPPPHILARTFILVIPGCPSCSSVSTAARPLWGITTRYPHSTQPPHTQSSFLLEEYKVSSCPHLSGHPWRTYRKMIARTRSCRVQVCICWAVIGECAREVLED